MTAWFEQIGHSISLWWQDVSTEFYQNFIYNHRWLQLLDGLKVTLIITLGAVCIGIILGILLALLRLSRNKLAHGFAQTYLTVFRGTPLLIQLLIVNYVVFSGVRISGMVVAIIAFGLNSGAYVAEIVRSGIQSIDRGQTEAARSLGLNQSQTMRYSILPQAFKNILPALGNEMITLLKDTSLVSVVMLRDVTKQAQNIVANTYSAYVPYISLAVIYLVIVLILTRLLGMLERRLRESDRR